MIERLNDLSLDIFFFPSFLHFLNIYRSSINVCLTIVKSWWKVYYEYLDKIRIKATEKKAGHETFF